MDYGVVAILLIQLVIAAMCMHAFQSLRAELKTLEILRSDTTEAKAQAAAANERSQKIETEHYHSVRRAVTDLQDDQKLQKKATEATDANAKILQGQIGSLKGRLDKLVKEEKEPLDDQIAKMTLPGIPAKAPPGLPAGFGKKGA